MKTKTKMTEAEIYIQTLARLYPTIYGTRDGLLEHIFVSIGTGYKWRDGKIVTDHEDRIRFRKMQAKVKKGTAPSVKDQAWLAHLAHAREELKRYPRVPKEKPSTLACRYQESYKDVDAVGQRYYVVEKYSPICLIPENVTPDWLALCVETLDLMESARIDYTAVTILPEGERKLFNLPPNPEGDKIAEEIVNKILEERGEVRKEKTAKEKAAEQAHWEANFSPTARARQANSQNEKARRIGAAVRAELRARGLV